MAGATTTFWVWTDVFLCIVVVWQTFPGTQWDEWFAERNCGGDSGGTYDNTGNSITNGTVCYKKLEKLTWDQIQYTTDNTNTEHHLGHVKFTPPNNDLKTWHDNFEYALTAHYCFELEDVLLDCQPACDGESELEEEGEGNDVPRVQFNYGFSKDTKICEEQCRNLTLAKQYGGRDDEGTISPDFYSTCALDKKKDTTSRRLAQEEGEEGEEGDEEVRDDPHRSTFENHVVRRRMAQVAWKPSNESIDLVTRIDQFTEDCLFSWVKDVSNWFMTDSLDDPTSTGGTFDLVTAIDNVVKTEERAGFLGSFTTSFQADDGFNEFMTSFTNDKGDDGTTIGNIVAAADFGASMMLSGMAKWQSMCNTIMALSTVKNAVDHTIANHTKLSTTRPLKIANICAYVLHLDAVRNLNLVKSSNTDALNTKLYNIETQKGDREVQTTYMKGLQRYETGYKQHYYESDLFAFDFHALSTVTGVADYTVYWNMSGASGEVFPKLAAPSGHWNQMVTMANNMFVHNLTGGVKQLGAIHIQGFPREFKCNRDEYFNAEPGTVDLNCPSLGVAGFFVNLASFIIGYMMMFFYWVSVAVGFFVCQVCLANNQTTKSDPLLFLMVVVQRRLCWTYFCCLLHCGHLCTYFCFCSLLLLLCFFSFSCSCSRSLSSW